MREIKFRAWDKTNKRWLHDFRLHPDGRVMKANLPLLAWGKLWRYENSTTSLEDIVLMQYTGLKDKNGKEVYEGDICIFDGTALVRIAIRKKPFAISFKSGCFLPENSDISMEDWFSGDYKECKVIGNIYENPELLKCLR